MILFAYASNMNFDEFAGHVSSAVNLGTGYLPGYRFVFNMIGKDASAKANVVPSNKPDAAVWGILIDLSEADRLKIFDPTQPWAQHLKLIPMDCIGSDGKTYKAHVFISKPNAVDDQLLPCDWYQQKLVAFARWQHLPEEYISSLAKMPHKYDPNEKRRLKRLLKLAKA